MNKYTLIAAGVVIIVALFIFLIYTTVSYKNITKTVNNTTSISTTSTIPNLLPKGVVYIKNLSYLVSFQDINWSIYSSSSCNLNTNGIMCYNAYTSLNASTKTLKMSVFLKNNLNSTIYLNNNSFTLLSLNQYPMSTGSCVNQTTNKKTNILFNNSITQCTILVNDSKFLPGTPLTSKFSIAYYLCHNLQCTSFSNSSTYLVNGNFNTTIIPTEKNPIINITSPVNLEEAQGLIYTYPAVFETPIALKLSSMASITSGFEVANITPSLPIIFSPGNQKLLHISLSIPTYNYTGNLSIRLNFTAPN